MTIESSAATEKTTIRTPDVPRRVPLSTYRLQLSEHFTFRDARNVLDYLDRLGVSDCYTSPYFTARPGSTHGYDVADHNSLNPELGGEPEFVRFVEALEARGMGHVLDLVPNHMGIDARSNRWWRDVLENGPCSPSARFFDIDWLPAKVDLADKVLLPILSDQYGTVLLAGQLQLAFEDGQLVLHYFDHELPLNPRQVPRVLRHGLEGLERDLGADDPDLLEFLSVLTALTNLPPYTDTTPASIATRRREKEVARRRLQQIADSNTRVRRHIHDAVRAFNGQPGRPESFDPLHELLEAQPYRLAYWRTAAHEINYRRFFDNNNLAGLRVEDAEVFEATHALLFDLMRGGRALSLRIDHPDGLYDPARYLGMLQDLARRAWGCDPSAIRPAYVVVEKILSTGESLTNDWPVSGTTGYTFLNIVNGLFVEPSSARRLRRLYARLTGIQQPFEDVIYESKRLIMETALASELNVLAHAVDRIAESNRNTRDFTLNSLREALAEVVACFPVYRTYVTEAGWTGTDREIIELAVARARRRSPAEEPSVFAFLRDVFLPPGGERRADGSPPTDRATTWRLQVTMRFQQYTAPVQAKGLEDTAFYRYNSLISLNEVGGDPSRVGRAPSDFHEANRERLARWPFELVATSTHDTKLGEDVRARLNVISELVEEWGREVSRWMRLNRGNRALVDGEPAPDRNDEYRFYQVLAGAWPPGHEGLSVPPELVRRLREYMIKAIKEAKVHTSWVNDNEDYDAAMATFVEETLAGPTSARFLTSFLPFARRLATLGMVNSLAQTVLKMTVPGVPDFYQGTELWDLSLVDPDNRRSIDFEERRRGLDELDPLLTCGADTPADARADRAARAAGLLAAWPDGRIKLYVTTCGLRMRGRDPDLFLAGRYLPLRVESTPGADAVAFARVHEGRGLVVVVPRLVAGVTTKEHPFPVGAESWKIARLMLPDELAGRTFTNLLTGERLEPTRKQDESWLFLARIFASLPVAMLTADSATATTGAAPTRP